ncbi:ubiquitin carboxyl-terminal hydrolase 9/13 [Cryptococcus neoformans C23]|uniref:ubiquitinyl hydrolase 1 n=2 Tax=Cryptococcus neoformans TaxID=5207 RepID=A0A854QGQ5_CRYNE|nr:ubiquitin carboxyl-terminal hydrolase 9/13 [Cryptococcus neoformans var. grubii H99]AUB25242.1 ubiquitin carboxyl-terminal hydrolase 9/13 [Cryptococcus neoformans var. grubii]OWZ31509.1 ubiquitin carboxyl-terminal hydrolase 9/13 [Cryptococcus neoformans var. grubii AD2-60a]OWZ42639.1 ubiquitin carboxyl-terminal hydrolase 9/13 [Cryptococcus neoformans var. grubii AD1-83a]OWZ43670.1 ubiquitin carboxyl-terminal hydrolase 9/13 [Cryptococcus neoformans var. grubii C23]OWZ54354.1 ubiquitin carbox|eukprot:XP_012050123.1 ubiquitin carboxyl-terminal hydrolase 9/13 [Cryptococcus neoformans var. grubii H99]
MSAFRKFVGNKNAGISASEGDQDPADASLLPRANADEERLWGIENFSNSCFCNSVLQALYACSTFRDFVEAYPDILPPRRPIGPSQVEKRYPSVDWDGPVPGWDPSIRLNKEHRAFIALQEANNPVTSTGGKEKRNWMGRKMSSAHSAPTLATLQANQPEQLPSLPNPFPNFDDPLLVRTPASDNDPPLTLFQTFQTLFYYFSHSPPHMPIKGKGQTKDSEGALIEYTEEEKVDDSGVEVSEKPSSTNQGQPAQSASASSQQTQSQGQNAQPSGPSKLASLPPPSTFRETGAWRAGQLGWGVVQPNDVMDAVKRSAPSFNNDDQHDAHEFFSVVVNTLAKEVDAVNEKLRAEGKEVAQMTAPWAKTFIEALFQGITTSETKCLSCETISSREEEFIDLSVDIEQHCSITSCLRQFSSDEMMSGREKFSCESCSGHQQAKRSIRIKRLPPILAVHLKRFAHNESYRAIKLFYRVNHPITLIPPNTTDNCENPDQIYDLVAIMVHIGNGPVQGHYVTVKRTPSGRWVMCDDDNIEAIEENQLEYWLGNRTQGQGYVLFYQARGITAEQLGLKVEKRKPNGVFEPVGEGVRYVDGYGQAPPMVPVASATLNNVRTVNGVREEEEEELTSSSGSIPASAPGLKSLPSASPIASPIATPSSVGSRIDRQFGFNAPANGVALESTARPPLKKELSDKKWYRRMSMSGISSSAKDKEKTPNSKDKTINGLSNGSTTSPAQSRTDTSSSADGASLTTSLSTSIPKSQKRSLNSAIPSARSWMGRAEKTQGKISR